jgi:hypothetical protein
LSNVSSGVGKLKPSVTSIATLISNAMRHEKRSVGRSVFISSADGVRTTSCSDD